MPILSETTKVKIGKRNSKHYKELGYQFNLGDKIEVKVKDLTHGSDAKIEILCDMCQKTKMIVGYNTYNQAIKNSGSYVCKECSHKKFVQIMQKKYGVDNPAQLESVKEKMKQTCLEKYGVEYYTLTDEYKERVKQTCIEKYGVEYSSQSQDVKNKHTKTCLERYGTEHPMQSQIVKDKTKATVQSKYGVDSILQVPEVKNKISDTNVSRYGYKYPIQSEEVQKKVRETIKRNFGVEYAMQSNEVKEKASQSFYKNSSVRTSRQQLYLCYIYQGVLNYPIKYYNVDIYLPDNNIVVEYNGGGHWLGKKFNQFTEEEFDKKEIIRHRVIKESGCKQMHIVSHSDKLPSDQILLQMLSDACNYFIDYPNHSWIEYDIDNSVVHNAEYKDGISYDYGKLRKIKDYDLSDKSESIA